ncbi:hypothetical protein CRG98_031164, partial [Punica granatum]
MDRVYGNGNTETAPSPKKPSFFKVLIGDFSNELRIPPAFVKNFRAPIPQKINIFSPAARRSWRVKLEKDKDGMFIKEGWMYGLSACEKEFIPSAPWKPENPTLHIEAHEESPAVKGSHRSPEADLAAPVCWPDLASESLHVRGILSFSNGWLDFLNNNNMKAGDVCVFELMDGRDDKCILLK